MIESGPCTPEGIETARRLRQASRAGIGYLVDSIALGRSGRHPLDALLLVTIVHSNVVQISADAALQRRYGELEAPPPNAMRRPVSISGLATSLHLPFESARRRIHALADDGLCVISPAGVIVPAEVLARPASVAMGFLAYERLRALYLHLRDLGFLADLPPPSTALAHGLVPTRAVARIAVDYFLRAADAAVAAFGDVITGLIFLEVFRANVAHLGLGPDPEHYIGPDQILLDSHRRPATPVAVAERLGLTQEAVQRACARLRADGRLEAQGDGLIAPARILGTGSVRRFADVNSIQLVRMFSRLSELGVLAIWDTLPPPAIQPS